jgi:hypothetical protein
MASSEKAWTPTLETLLVFEKAGTTTAYVVGDPRFSYRSDAGMKKAADSKISTYTPLIASNKYLSEVESIRKIPDDGIASRVVRREIRHVELQIEEKPDVIEPSLRLHIDITLKTEDTATHPTIASRNLETTGGRQAFAHSMKESVSSHGCGDTREAKRGQSMLPGQLGRYLGWYHPFTANEEDAGDDNLGGLELSGDESNPSDACIFYYCLPPFTIGT